MTDVATSKLCGELKAKVDEFLTRYQEQHPDLVVGLEYYVSGLPLLFEQIEEQFVEDLIVTYIGGLILISLMVFLVLQSVADAVTAMIPNVLPAIGVLGGHRYGRCRT